MPIIKHRAIEDHWLTDLVGRPCFNILKSDEEISLRRLSHQLHLSRAFATWKIDSQDILLSEYAHLIGFKHIETSLVLGLSSRMFRRPAKKVGCSVSEAVTADEASVAEIAKSAFSFTRFHRDQRFGQEIGHLVKAAWVQNYFRGQRGDGMLVARRGEKVIGFLLYIVGGTGELIIDLIAVSPHATRQGVGRSLVAALVEKVQGNQLVSVGTQACNTPSHNLYSSLGFQLEKTVSVFHYHTAFVLERESQHLEPPK